MNLNFDEITIEDFIQKANEFDADLTDDQITRMRECEQYKIQYIEK